MTRKLLWTATVLTGLLMLLGNVVSVTGAGLACPDWPLCHGKLIPPLKPDVLLEYGHRLVGLLTSLSILAATIAVWRSPWTFYRWTTGAVILLLAIQIPLGGVVVATELQPVITSVHLLIAFLIFSLLFASAYGVSQGWERLRLNRDWPTALVGALLLQVFFGALVRHYKAGLACPEFPTCLDGAWIPPYVDHVTGVHLLHRFWGYWVFLLSLPLLRKGTWGLTAVSLLLLQIALGAATVLTRIHPHVVTFHYLNALVILAHLLPRTLKEASPLPQEAERL